MYLLFLDESGTHSPSPAFILGGVAIHELDAAHLLKRIESGLTYRLAPLGLNAENFELHAKDMKGGKDDWSAVPWNVRMKILGGMFQTISTYSPIDPSRPMAMFGAVVDTTYRDREERAYELVLNKFDEMLDRVNRVSDRHEAGLVIHDRIVVDTPLKKPERKPKIRPKANLERRIQLWTSDWQEVAGHVGKLNNMAHVPLFADSRATRLLQVADFVAWALWRYYGLTPKPRDERWISDLWPHFDHANGQMHGLIHVTPDFARQVCNCKPCDQRLNG